MIFFNLRKRNLLIHLRPIIHALKDSGFPITVIVEDHESSSSLPMEISQFPLLKESQLQTAQSPGITISADIHSKAPRNTLHLNTLHNQPVKYWQHPGSLLSQIDGFLCWGHFQKQYIEHLYRIAGLMNPLLFETGAPLLDRLFDNTTTKEQLACKHGIDLNNKTILIAPSWNEGLVLRERGDELFRVLSKAPQGLNVLLRLHPACMFTNVGIGNDYFNGGENWKSRILSLSETNDSLFDFSEEPDGIEALMMSDCVVTDISSIAWDALTLETDVFFIDCPDWPKVASKNPNFGKPSEILTLEHDYLNAGARYGNGVIKLDDLEILLNSYVDQVPLPQRQASPFRLRKKLLYNPGTATYETTKLLKELYYEVTGRSHLT